MSDKICQVRVVACQPDDAENSWNRFWKAAEKEALFREFVEGLVPLSERWSVNYADRGKLSIVHLPPTLPGSTSTNPRVSPPAGLPNIECDGKIITLTGFDTTQKPVLNMVVTIIKFLKQLDMSLVKESGWESVNIYGCAELVHRLANIMQSDKNAAKINSINAVPNGELFRMQAQSS